MFARNLHRSCFSSDVFAKNSKMIMKYDHFWWKVINLNKNHFSFTLSTFDFYLPFLRAIEFLVFLVSLLHDFIWYVLRKEKNAASNVYQTTVHSIAENLFTKKSKKKKNCNNNIVIIQIRHLRWDDDINKNK